MYNVNLIIISHIINTVHLLFVSHFQLSEFSCSAWEWMESRQAYYLHQFSKEQPDLDWRNPNVVKEMEVKCTLHCCHNAFEII